MSEQQFQAEVMDEQKQSEELCNKDFLKDVWVNLSAVDVSGKIQKKMNLSYLSWAWAWGVLMEEYPNSSYCFKTKGEGKRMEVWCFLCVSDGVNEYTRAMWLPIMDNRNNSISDPDARDISDARMRCLVKAIAMFGLGHFIYAGEDLPNKPKTPLPPKQAPIPDDVKKLSEYMREALDSQDYPVVYEHYTSIQTEHQAAVWSGFNSKQRATMKAEFTKIREGE